jgi:hypothetical protein
MADGALFHAIGSLLQEERHWAQLVYLIIFAFGDVILYLRRSSGPPRRAPRTRRES